LAPRRLIGFSGCCLVVLACSGKAGSHAIKGAEATDAAEVPRNAAYCDGQLRLLELPIDPSARGPWKVGSRAVAVAGLDAEVWYPASRGSADGL
jgi:hypothetical protein